MLTQWNIMQMSTRKNMTFVSELMELERIPLSEERNSAAGRQMLHVSSHL